MLYMMGGGHGNMVYDGGDLNLNNTINSTNERSVDELFCYVERAGRQNQTVTARIANYEWQWNQS